MKRVNYKTGIWMLGMASILATMSCTDFREEAWNNRGRYVDTTHISIESDAEVLTKRLSFVDDERVSGLALSRVAKSVPSIPDGAIQLAEAPTNYNSGVTLSKDSSYYVEKGETFNGSISGNSVDNVTIYVAGTLEVTAWWLTGNNVTIQVLPTGNLKYASDSNNQMIALVKDGVTINSWGTFTTYYKGSGIRIAPLAALNIYKSAQNQSFYVNPQGGMWDCSFWIEGSFQADIPVVIDGNMLVNNGKAVFNSELTVSKEVYIQGGSMELNGCTTIEKDFKFVSAGNLLVSDYLNVCNMETCQGTINISNGALVQVVENLFLTSQSNTRIVGPMVSYAVIKAGSIFSEDTKLSNFMSGNIDIQSSEIRQGNRWWYADPITLDTSNTNGVIVNGNTVIQANGCNPGTGSSEGAGSVHLVEIARLSSPANYYSATSIDFNGNLAYVSWHINPKKYSENFGGAIDVINITDRKVLQCRVNSDVKYSHTCFYDGWLFSAGDDYHNGAVLSKIHLQNGLFADNKEEQLVNLTGNSGNCVEVVGNTLLTASGTEDGGFDLLQLNAAQKQYSVPALEAKFVYSNGEKIVTLNNMSLGTVNVYDTRKGRPEDMLATPVLTFNAGPIAPVDGKNVIMCSEKYIYVCMGKNGLHSFDINTGREVAYYDIKQVNGIDIDGDYVYVANGYGITVLDKESLAYISSFVDNSGSANYVRKGEDGFIYVAYGTTGVRIFRLE